MIAVRDGDKVYTSGRMTLSGMKCLGYSQEHAQQYLHAVQSIKHSDVQKGIQEIFRKEEEKE